MKRNGKPTNLYLCQDLRRNAQRLAKSNGESLSNLVERALTKLLNIQSRKESSVVQSPTLQTGKSAARNSTARAAA